MDPAAASTSTSVKAQHLAIAIALRDSAARPLVTVKQAARLLSAHTQILACLLKGHVEALASTNARNLDLEIVAVLRATVVQLPITALRGARLGLGPALLLASHPTARVAEQTSTSVKALATAIVAALTDTVESPLIIAAQAVNLVSVHTPQ